MAEKNRTAPEELELAAVQVVTSLSQKNLKDTGGTWTVMVPRHKIERLHEALEAMYPGWVERIYVGKKQFEAQEKAK